MERSTSQRRAIRQAFQELNRPLSPQEVLDQSRTWVPRLGIATVYRTLKGLVEEGWLVRVHIPGGPVRYELAGKSHHHHFHCRSCGKVFVIEGCPGSLKALAPRGFHVEEHDIVLHGYCAGCWRQSN
jgi:Fur family ferric uptake transcriptional regulator